MIDYKKQKAVIIPQWVLDMIIDQLDIQLDSLLQEYEWNARTGAEMKEITKEVGLYEEALAQLSSQC